VDNDLTALTADELAALEAEAVAAFTALKDEGSPDIDAMRQLADSIKGIRAEQALRAESAAALAAEVDALAADVLTLSDESVVDTDEDVPVAADEDSDPVVEAEQVLEPELVTAGASRVNLALIRRHAPTVKPAPKGDSHRGLAITAGADLPGLSAGQVMTKDQMAQAFHDKARGIAVTAGAAQYHTVARIERPTNAVFGDNDVENEAILARVTSQQALVAAGGWCAPSEVFYDFFGIDAADGLIDLPTITARRGGIRYPVSPSIADASGALWSWTAQQDIDAHTTGGADPTKPCLVIPCPTWNECTLQADGLCLTHGNLSDRALPELTRRFIDLTMNAHEHRLSGLILTAMATAATDVTIAAGAMKSDAYGDLMAAIDLQVADYRSQYRMSESAILEVVLPSWAREALRANLAMRAGVDLLAVTDRQLSDYFAARKVRPQFVQDWQALYNTNPATGWPATIKFLVYAAGTFVKASAGVLDIGVIRDSTLNKTNDHTAAFTEEFWCLAMVGHSAREVTVTISVDGVTACCA
jgi:hypothetical protein